MNLKDINIDGKSFKYDVRKYVIDGKNYYTTFFYCGMQTFKWKRFWFFGKEIAVERPICVFTISNMNIEDPKYSKEQVMERIAEGVKLMNRREEIKRGEIV